MQGTSQYNPRTSLYYASKKYILEEDTLQKFESENTEIDVNDFFSNKDQSLKGYIRNIYHYCIAAFLEGDYRYRNIATCFNFTAKARFKKFHQGDAIIERVTYCFTQCGSFNLKWRRKAVKFIADLNQPDKLKVIVERDLRKTKPDLPSIDIRARLMAIDEESVPDCYHLVNILLCLKGKARIREQRSFYHDGNDCLKKYLHSEEELSDIDMLVNKIAKKGVTKELIIRYSHLAFFGDMRYLHVALGLNGNSEKFSELRRAEKVLKQNFNPNWREQALSYIGHLKERKYDSSDLFIIREKINLAILHKHPAFIKFKSHLEVRNKLLCIDIDSVLECYSLVLALQGLKAMYRFVDLGGYEVPDDEYKPFLTSVSLSRFKEEIENESVNDDVLKRIKRLFNVEIMPGKIESLNDFLQIKTLEHINYQLNIAIATGKIVFWNNAYTLMGEGKQFWGDGFGEKIREEVAEIQELLKSDNYNSHWRQDALAFIEKYSSGTQTEGMSIVRSETNAAIRESRLPQFNGPAEYTHIDVRNYLAMTTLNSVYSRYRTVEGIRSLIGTPGKSSSEKGSMIERMRSKLVNPIEKFFSAIHKWPIPSDLVLKHPFYKNNKAWEKYIAKHGKDSLSIMNLLPLAALATSDSRWLKLYKEIIEFYPKLNNQELFNEAEIIFDHGIEDWQCRDYAKNLANFLDYPEESSAFKTKLQERYGIKKFKAMKELLESNRLEDMLEKYRLVEEINQICRESLQRRNSKDQESEESASHTSSSKGKEIDVNDETDSSLGSSVLVRSDSLSLSSLEGIKLSGLEIDKELMSKICNNENSLARLAVHFMAHEKYMSGVEIQKKFARYEELVDALVAMSEDINLWQSFIEEHQEVKGFTNNSVGN